MSNNLDLTNLKISESYQRLVQFSDGNFYNGLGNPINFLFITGTGSFGYIPKFTSLRDVTNSSILEDGGFIKINSNVQIDGFLYLNTNVYSKIYENTIISSIPKDLGKAAFFDYWISNENKYMRSGSIMSIWDSDGGNVKFTDVSTGDLNGSTEHLNFNIQIDGDNVVLIAIPTNGTFWDIKVSTRVL